MQTQVGVSSELLVMYKLSLLGLSSARVHARPFDLLVEQGRRHIRVQVKGCNVVNRHGSYKFNNFKTCKNLYTLMDADLMAYVALDIERVVFRRVEEIKNKTVTIREQQFYDWQHEVADYFL